MAPYLRHINSDRTDLIATLEEKNKKQLEEIDAKLKEAEEQEGDSEISELLRKKAMYLCRIGDKVSSTPILRAGSSQLVLLSSD